MVTSAPEPLFRLLTLARHFHQILPLALLVGEKSFGALARPVTILNNKSGVFVNDELRGQL